MKKFLSKNFMLTNDVAKKLYHDYAKTMPIIDYHCHISPKEIAEDKRYDNITEIWLGGDHYKWRAIRSNGVPEELVTGNADPYEKFKVFAATMPKLIGNPMYHWSHLELKRYFGYTGILNESTCNEVWELCNEKLHDPSMSARQIVRRSNVKLICTTDDPCDTLEWHKKISLDPDFTTKVLPAFRPDKGVNLEKPDYADYIHKLCLASGMETINNFCDLLLAFKLRLDHFEHFGCKAADHGIDDEIPFNNDYTTEQLDEIFNKALDNAPLTRDEIAKFKTALLIFFAGEYNARGWVMQIHFGVSRNNNTEMFDKLGPDTGYDSINGAISTKQLILLLNEMNTRGALPKMIIYSINPVDNAAIGSIIGCFQGPGTAGRIQQGSAWWFNDNNAGMREQMTSLANLGVLGNFVGMLTDSRSFLSYTRHEYFRRILCDMIGNWVEHGEYPCDYPTLEKLVKDISFNNTNNFFEFGVQI